MKAQITKPTKSFPKASLLLCELLTSKVLVAWYARWSLRSADGFAFSLLFTVVPFTPTFILFSNRNFEAGRAEWGYLPILQIATRRRRCCCEVTKGVTGQHGQRSALPALSWACPCRHHFSVTEVSGAQLPLGMEALVPGAESTLQGAERENLGVSAVNGAHLKMGGPLPNLGPHGWSLLGLPPQGAVVAGF